MRPTYIKIAIGIFILLFALTSGCDDKEPVIEACGVANPDRNLPWLESMLYDFSAVALPKPESVDLYMYESMEIILITWKSSGGLDTPTGSIYDCGGTSLYMCGGNQPIDSCSIVINNSNFITRIWELNE